MNKGAVMKLASGISFLLLLLFQLLGLLSGLGAMTTEAVIEARPRLFAHFETAFFLTLAVDLCLLFYGLYSLNLLGRAKSEYAREFIRIADIGLFFYSLLMLGERLTFHRQLFLWSMLLRLLVLLVLLRVPMAYRGNPRRLFLPRAAFDFVLGAQLFLLINTADWFFEPMVHSLQSAWSLTLVLLLSAASALIGIRLRSPAAILADMAGLGGLTWFQLSPSQLNAGYPELYIAVILMLGALLAAFLVALLRRRREFWRG